MRQVMRSKIIDKLGVGAFGARNATPSRFMSTQKAQAKKRRDGRRSDETAVGSGRLTAFDND